MPVASVLLVCLCHLFANNAQAQLKERTIPFEKIEIINGSRSKVHFKIQGNKCAQTKSWLRPKGQAVHQCTGADFFDVYLINADSNDEQISQTYRLDQSKRYQILGNKERGWDIREIASP